MDEPKSMFAACLGQETSTDVANAIAPMETAVRQRITKRVLRDLISGLKILVTWMQKEEEVVAFEVIIPWLKLLLLADNNIDPRDDQLRNQFDKYLPYTVSYIAAALCLRPKNVPNYHSHLLDIATRLLNEAKEEILQKVASVDAGVIAGLWGPIKFVGDFNTQLMVLRLTVKILKCIDDNQQKKIIDTICASHKQMIQESIACAVKVANYQIGKFENTARELLNNLNINLSESVLVYSMRCREIRFGTIATFYKPVNADNFWIDLNYCPRTLTFAARYRVNKAENYSSIDICLKIHKLTLDENTLTVTTNAPPQFSHSISKLNYLTIVRKVDFQLIGEEVLRLRENHFMLDYYNKTSSASKINAENVLERPTQASNALSTNCKQKSANHEKCHPNNAAFANPNATSPTPQVLGAYNFKKSYTLLIGYSTNPAQQNFNQETADKDASSSSSSNDCLAYSTPLPQGSTNANHKFTSSLQCESIAKFSENVECGPPVIDDRQPTSLDVNLADQFGHPSCSNKRRFFKTSKEASNGNADKNTKKIKLTAKPRKRCQTKRKILTPPTNRKQVNKVKPMNHLAKCNGDPAEAAQEYVENGGIINITNFLNNNNESSAVFNEDERRIILQNVSRINEDLERSAQRFFRNNGAKNTSTDEVEVPPVLDTFENRNVNFAKPGQSYRNFSEIVPEVPSLTIDKPKLKRTRKYVRRANKVQGKKDSQISPTKRGKRGGKKSKATRSVETRKSKRAVNTTDSENMAPTIDNTTAPEANEENSCVRALYPKKKTSYLANTESDTYCTADNPRKTNGNKEIQIFSDKPASEPLMKNESLSPKYIKQSVAEVSSNEYNGTDLDNRNVDSDVDVISVKVDMPRSSEKINVLKDPPKSARRQLIFSNRELGISLQANDKPQHRRDTFTMEDMLLDKDIMGIHSQTIADVINNLERDEPSTNIPDATQIGVEGISASRSPLAVQLPSDKLANSFLLDDLHEARDDVNLRQQTLEDLLTSPERETISKLPSTLRNDIFECLETSNSPLDTWCTTNTDDNQGNVDRTDDSFDSLFYSRLIPCNRSEDNSNDESYQEDSNLGKSPRILEERVTPPTISVERIATKSVTKSARRAIPFSQPNIQACEVTTSVTTRQVISKDIFLMPSISRRSREVAPLRQTNNENSSETSTGIEFQMTENKSSPELDDFQHNSISKYIQTYVEASKEGDETQNPLHEEIFGILQKYKESMKQKCRNLEKTYERKTNIDYVIEKVVAVSKQLLVAVENERNEMEDCERELERITQQLNKHWELYQEKTTRFKCFKENTERILNAIANMDLVGDINKSYKQFSAEFLRNGSTLRTKLWQEFIKNTTDNFVNTISSLSDI